MRLNRILPLLFLSICIICIITSISPVYAATSGDYTYTVKDNKATITKYSGLATNLAIPSTLGGYTVTTLDVNAFNDCSNLVTVSIPGTVDTINTPCFLRCSNLVSIAVNSANASFCSVDGVVYSKDKTKLICCPPGMSPTYTVLDGVTTFSNDAFRDCASLIKIVLPDTLTWLGWESFRGCTSLESVNIPDGVTVIGIACFYDCSSLKSVTLPEGITAFYSYAFYNCTSLESIVIPGSVSTIQDRAFSNCSSLNNIIIPEGIETLSSGLFLYCTNLETVNLPESLKAINQTAFMGCDSLSSISIPGSVTTIGRDAFLDCKSLENISIPASVLTIGVEAFGACTSLTSITVDPMNTVYCDVNGVLYNKEKSELIAVPAGLSGSFSIPQSTQVISAYAFLGCSHLNKIIVPNSIETINSSAFSECDDLTDIFFAGTNSKWSSLSSVDSGLKDTVSIHYELAAGQCGDNTEWRLYSDGVLLITGNGSMNDYEFIGDTSSAPWSDYNARINTVIVDGGVTSIGSYTFYGSAISRLTLENPDAVLDESALDPATSDITIVAPECSYAHAYAITHAYQFAVINGAVSIHSPSDVAIENEISPTCTKTGSHDVVTYCLKCGLELSRENVIDEKQPHNPADSVVENEALATCKDAGSYDLVIYCSNCGEELSREFVTVEQLPHTPQGAVRENEVASTCTKTGSYDEVVYCSECGEELSRETKTIALLDHTPSEIVIENETKPSCTTAGNYDAIVYCSECGAELRREQKTTDIDPSAHNYVYIEEVPATRVKTGVQAHYECAYCGEYFDLEKNRVNTDALVIPLVDPDTPIVVNSGTFGDNLIWSLDDFGVLTISGSGAMPDYSQTGYPWNDFKGEVTSIVVESGVSTIGNNAFEECTNLASISISEGVTSIGNYAFSECSSLANITIPESVTSIGNSAFSGCIGLRSITIPFASNDHPFGRLFGIKSYEGTIETKQNRTSYYIPSSLEIVTILSGDLPANYFYDCSRLTTICLPCDTTTIGYCAFSGCSNLTNIAIPDNITSIDISAFSRCYSLKNYHIPNISAWMSFRVLAGWSISGETHLYLDDEELTNVIIPDNVTSIGESAFSDCSSLMSITIPASVTSIGNNAFSGCSGLTSITIPEGVMSIGDSAFSGCSGLTSITIPETVTSIGPYAFNGISLEYLEFLGDVPSEVGVRIVGNGYSTYYYDEITLNSDILVLVPKDKSGWTVPIWNGYRTAYKGISPDDNTALNANNYNNNGVKFELDEANFTAKIVGFIGNESGIVKIPARVSKEGARYTVTTIYDLIPNIFENKPYLKNLEIGSNVSEIDSGALRDISNLESVTVNPGNRNYVIEDGIIYNKDKTELIRVLQNKTQVSILNTVKTIKANAFSGCSKLQTISLPNSITTIEYGAFSDCSGIKNMVIPDSVTSLGSSILSGCSSLETLTIPFITDESNYYHYPIGYLFGAPSSGAEIDTFSKVEQYYQWRDDGYTSSNTYYIPNSLRSVKVTGGSLYYGAFYNCSMIEEITLGKDVVFTGERAFYGCKSLERINVDKGNKALASDANGVLYSKDYKTIKCYPSGKKTVSYQIDDRVEAIDLFAFYNCLNLESLYVPESVTDIPTNSIAYYDLTMFVYRGSAAEVYAQEEDIAYRYIGETKAKNVRVTSEYGLPVIASGEANASVIGDYDGVSGVVDGAAVEYDSKTSGLQTVKVTYEGETIETEAVVYDPSKEQFHDFGDVAAIDEETQTGLAGMFDANGRFLGLSKAIVLDDHEIVLIPNEVYEDAVEAKLMVIDSATFSPAAEAVEEGL